MKPFDFNYDGKVDPVERGLEYHIYEQVQQDLKGEGNDFFSPESTPVSKKKSLGGKTLGLFLLLFAAILGKNDAPTCAVVFGIAGLIFALK